MYAVCSMDVKPDFFLPVILLSMEATTERRKETWKVRLGHVCIQFIQWGDGRWGLSLGAEDCIAGQGWRVLAYLTNIHFFRIPFKIGIWDQ